MEYLDRAARGLDCGGKADVLPSMRKAGRAGNQDEASKLTHPRTDRLSICVRTSPEPTLPRPVIITPERYQGRLWRWHMVPQGTEPTT